MGICVKNGAKNIAEALDSIECQDFPHEAMEIIIVDDGSKDNTLEVVRKRVQNIDIRTRVFQFEWQGLGAARNVIVKLAEGDYIIWVDSDMILPKDHVRKQISFMERNQKIGIAKAKYGAMQDNNIIGFLENIGYVAADYIHGRKSTVRTLGTGGSIYRVKSIRQVGGFDNKISGVGEDMDAEIRVRKAGWGLFLGSPAIFYERRRESIVEIWREGVWHGYGGHKIIKKHGSISGLEDDSTWRICCRRHLCATIFQDFWTLNQSAVTL